MNDFSLGSAVYGELRQWHRVTIDFAGPDGAENRKTFYDTRLDVTFTNQKTGETMVVPGFFAADGDAANTGATSGDVWRVHFNPPSQGEWTYTATFREGDDVAASAKPAGAIIGGLGDLSGGFNIIESDKSGADFRAHGMLEYVGEHYLVHAGTGAPFIKAGPGSPENFLAYSGFDNTGDRHDYKPHLQDWRPGDPTWSGGEGKEIIGAVNYLSSEGLNSMYMMLNNVAGDGREVWPWADESLGSINKGSANISASKVSAFDVSKLEQWEILFDHMDRSGINIHAFLQETENDQLLNGGALGAERAVYMREMVARFGHHNGLTWNLGEENTNTPAELRDHAAFLEAVDPYDHFISTHTYPKYKDEVFNPQLGNDLFDGASIQDTTPRDDVLEWREKSAEAGRKWVVNWDETGGADRGLDPDTGGAFGANNHDDRRGEMWKALMAGAGGVEWYFGYKNPHNDLNLEDFRSRDDGWDWTAAASEFLETLPLLDMNPADHLSPTKDAYVLADPGDTYVVYLENGGSARLDLKGVSGEFDVMWFDPRNGGALKTSGVKTVDGGGVVNLGAPPNNSGKDWAVLVEKKGGSDAASSKYAASLAQDDDDSAPQQNSNQSSSTQKPSTQTTSTNKSNNADDGPALFGANKQGVFKLAAEDVPAGGDWVRSTKYPGFEGDSAYVWTGPNRYGGTKPGDNAADILSFDIKVDDPGTYFLGIAMGRTKDPYPNARSDEANDVYVRMDGGPWLKVFAGGMAWEKANDKFGQTFDVAHEKSPAQFDLSKGVHTFEVAGRSTGTIIDYFQLSETRSDVAKKGLPLSPVLEGSVEGSYEPPQNTAPEPKAQPKPEPEPQQKEPAQKQPQEQKTESKQPAEQKSDTASSTTTSEPIGDAAPVGEGRVALYLADSKTDKTIAAIKPGEAIPASLVAGRDIAIYAEAAPGQAGSIGSVVLSYKGHSRAENVAPYALFGDEDGAFSEGTGLAPGSHAVALKVYSGPGGTGRLLEETTVKFDVAKEGAAPSQAKTPAYDDADKDQNAKQAETKTPTSNAKDKQASTTETAKKDAEDAGAAPEQTEAKGGGSSFTKGLFAALSGNSASKEPEAKKSKAPAETKAPANEQPEKTAAPETTAAEDNAPPAGVTRAYGVDDAETAYVGGDGDDILSIRAASERSTTTEVGLGADRVILYGAEEIPDGNYHDMLKVLKKKPVKTAMEYFGAVHEIDLGKRDNSSDTITLISEIDAQPKYLLKHSQDNGQIDGRGLAGENGAAYDHWAGVFGFVDIVGFDPQNDTLQLEGHTTRLGEGWSRGGDYYQTIYSEQNADNPSGPRAGAAHDDTFLGLIRFQDGGGKGEEIRAAIEIEAMRHYVVNGLGEEVYAGDPTENRVGDPSAEDFLTADLDDLGEDGQAAGDAYGDGQGAKAGQASKLLRFGLADTGSNQLLTQVLTGQAIAASLLLGHATTLFATPLDGAMEPGSVRISMDGHSRTENFVPFALFGDKDGDYFAPGKTFNVGETVVLFEVFEEDRAGGAVLETFELVIAIENDLGVSDAEANALLAAGDAADSLADILIDGEVAAASSATGQSAAADLEDGGASAAPVAVNAGKLIEVNGLLIAQGGGRSGPATFEFSGLDEDAPAAVNITVRAPMEGAGFNAGGKFADYFIVEFSEEGGPFERVDMLGFDPAQNAFVSEDSGARIGDAYSTLGYALEPGVGEVTVRLTPHVTGVKEFFVISDVNVSADPDGAAYDDGLAQEDQPLEDTPDDLDQADALLAAVMEESGGGALQSAPSSAAKKDDLQDLFDAQDADAQDGPDALPV